MRWVNGEAAPAARRQSAKRKAAPIGGGCVNRGAATRKRTRIAPRPQGGEPPPMAADARNEAPRYYRIWERSPSGVLLVVFATPYSLLRRFAAGTGRFVRLGASRCEARARPCASRRHVRLAGYCASVRPAFRPVILRSPRQRQSNRVKNRIQISPKISKKTRDKI